jgi:putative flippase GtrA
MRPTFWQKLLFDRELRRFIVVGGIGFLIDSGILTLLTAHGKGVFESRLVSFFFAVTATWTLNRWWTFRGYRQRRQAEEYAGYLFTQIAGAAINLSVFYGLTHLFGWLSQVPVLPLGIGAGVSMVFTYLVSRFLIFKKAD